MKTKRESSRIATLRRKLERLGHRKFKLWWEPIGPALEMCGHSGGYMFVDEDGQQWPLGISLDEAMRAAEHYHPGKSFIRTNKG